MRPVVVEKSIEKVEIQEVITPIGKKSYAKLFLEDQAVLNQAAALALKTFLLQHDVFATISLLTIACPSAFEASSLAFIALDFASAFDSSLPPDFSTASASAAAFKAASAFSYATAFAAVSALIASLVFAAASSATILFASVTASIFTAISFF